MRTEARAVVAALALAWVLRPGTAAAECVRGAAATSYADAQRAFEARRYDESIELLRHAYGCDPNPVYLANIARANEEAHRPKDAVSAWREYLVVATDKRERKETEGRISVLTKVIADLDRAESERIAAEEARRRAETLAHVAPHPSASPAPEHHVSTGAWITSSVGVAGLAAGAMLGILSSTKHESAVSEPSVVFAETLQSQAHGFATAANLSFAAGGALALGGAV